MKASDFNFPNELQFDFNTGLTTFRNSRMCIFDANVMGLMREELVKMIGWEKAREFFVRFNYQNGYEECLNMKNNYTFDNDMEWLAAGPTLHTWRGIVKATPKEIRFNKKTGEFFFHGIWHNSYEAEQYLSFNEPANESVCWSLVGYASGYASALLGSKCITIETHCKGKGDDYCEHLIKPVSQWGEEAKIYIDILKDF